MDLVRVKCSHRQAYCVLSFVNSRTINGVCEYYSMAVFVPFKHLYSTFIGVYSTHNVLTQQVPPGHRRPHTETLVSWSTGRKETECVRPDLDQIDNLIVVICYNEEGDHMTTAEVQGVPGLFSEVQNSRQVTDPLQLRGRISVIIFILKRADCTCLGIERHRLYAGSTGSFADCEENAHLTSLRHD
ncbi:hypothetical protein J6590_094566 [Homalodisca vitripennis]|nr:hypothetical protein J6590_094566 [Homalodisca vitripennis]